MTLQTLAVAGLEDVQVPDVMLRRVSDDQIEVRLREACELGSDWLAGQFGVSNMRSPLNLAETVSLLAEVRALRAEAGAATVAEPEGVFRFGPEMQSDVAQWRSTQFGAVDAVTAMAVLAEEAGEVARCLTKKAVGIRGSDAYWDDELRKELGDVVIAAIGVAIASGNDLSECVAERWATVRTRDFSADRAATVAANEADRAAGVPVDPDDGF